MSNYNLKFLSKNKTFSQNSFIFFKNLFKIFLTSYYQKQKQKQKFTLLKSPHVNKTAQEQFEYRLFYKDLKLQFLNKKKNKLFLILFKKFKNNLFSHSKLNLKLFINKQNFKKQITITKFKLLNINKTLKKQQLKLENKTKYKKLKKYLKFLDLYGEIMLKN